MIAVILALGGAFGMIFGIISAVFPKKIATWNDTVRWRWLREFNVLRRVPAYEGRTKPWQACLAGVMFFFSGAMIFLVAVLN